jgi:hypothetical protein
MLSVQFKMGQVVSHDFNSVDRDITLYI